MKIALCVERFDPAQGGQAIWTRGFAMHLLNEGHEVHVVSCSFGNHGLAIQPHPVPWRWAPLARARRFQAALRTIDADVVHDASVTVWPGVWHPHTGSDLNALDRLISAEPPARRLRAALSPKMRLLRAQMFWLEARQAKDAAQIVAVSELVRTLLIRRHRGADARIETIVNGTDTAFFVPPAGGRIKRNSADEIVFLMVAHNPVLKGLDVALRALSILVRDGRAVRLMVAGNEGDPVWRRLAVDFGIANQVTYLGVVHDMRPIYAASDVLVHPTRWDACSLVVLEAMASGLPVVTSPMNGAADFVVPGVSGFIQPSPEDTDALAGFMHALLTQETRLALGQAARAAIEAHDVRDNYRAVEALLLRTKTVRRVTPC
jgi:UDP-glucose:(heptosyl)LPS alpha-1,3-glucosyltransferase